jgi:hypothetical protein
MKTIRPKTTTLITASKLRFDGDNIIRMYGVISSWIMRLPPERKVDCLGGRNTDALHCD